MTSQYLIDAYERYGTPRARYFARKAADKQRVTVKFGNLCLFVLFEDAGFAFAGKSEVELPWPSEEFVSMSLSQIRHDKWEFAPVRFPDADWRQALCEVTLGARLRDGVLWIEYAMARSTTMLGMYGPIALSEFGVELDGPREFAVQLSEEVLSWAQEAVVQ